MLFECWYSYFPPLKTFNETWNHLIFVTNERIKWKIRCRMTKGSTFSWGSVYPVLLQPLLLCSQDSFLLYKYGCFHKCSKRSWEAVSRPLLFFRLYLSFGNFSTWLIIRAGLLHSLTMWLAPPSPTGPLPSPPPSLLPPPPPASWGPWTWPPLLTSCHPSTSGIFQMTLVPAARSPLVPQLPVSLGFSAKSRQRSFSAIS